MVLDKNAEPIRNGRRSRGPSPNNHSSDSSDEDEPAEKIRVGKEYQAIIPAYIPPHERKLDQCPDGALLVWAPTNTISETKLDHFMTVAKEKYGYNGEQALGMLFWHRHVLQNAMNDLPNFTPFPDEWTVEDKVLFEQAYQFHGKSFHRIRQMLPDKSIACLVKHYYSWKKTRCRTSLMDKHAKKLSGRAGGTTEEGSAASDAGSELGSNTDSDTEDKKEGEGKTTSCSNCGVNCTISQSTTKGALCNSCFSHWRVHFTMLNASEDTFDTGSEMSGSSLFETLFSTEDLVGKRTGCVRPTVGPSKGRDRHTNSALARSKRKPPRGMYINHDDLVALSSGPPGQGDAILKSMEQEIIALKSKVQANKQVISKLKAKTEAGLGDLRPSDNNARINARWTNDEMLLAVQGIAVLGKDFSTIADIIGTKTEAHMRSFFVNQRKRFKLEEVLSGYEENHGPVETDINSKMEVDNDRPLTPSTSSPSSPSTPKQNSTKAK